MWRVGGGVAHPLPENLSTPDLDLNYLRSTRDFHLRFFALSRKPYEIVEK